MPTEENLKKEKETKLTKEQVRENLSFFLETPREKLDDVIKKIKSGITKIDEKMPDKYTKLGALEKKLKEVEDQIKGKKVNIKNNFLIRKELKRILAELIEKKNKR
jgi:hypothetical protein